MITCPNCHNPVQEGSPRCPYCGYPDRMQNPFSPQQPNQQPQYYQQNPQYPQQNMYQNQQQPNIQYQQQGNYQNQQQMKIKNKQSPKKKILWIILAAILFIIVLSAIVGSSGNKSNSSSSNSSSTDAAQLIQQIIQQTSAQQPVAAQNTEIPEIVNPTATTEPKSAAAEGQIGDYIVKLNRYELTQDYEGKDAISVYFQFTNNSKENAAFFTTILPKLFQNGVECQTAILLSDDNLSNYSNEIQPGISVEVKMSFTLSDKTTPVEMDIDKLITFNSNPVIYTLNIADGTFSLKK